MKLNMSEQIGRGVRVCVVIHALLQSTVWELSVIRLTVVSMASPLPLGR